MSRVALITDEASAALDDDLPPLVHALAAAGARPTLVAWDRTEPDAVGADLAVIRSPWEYHLRRDAYLQWLGALTRRVPVHNDVAVVAWNTDKRYLADLAAAGFAVTPTTFLPPGAPLALPAGGEFVVKPTVSAGSRDTARYRAADREAAAAHVRAIWGQGKVAMIQPYLAGVDVAGETAVVHLDGRFSHGLRKGPLLRLDAPLVEGVFAVEEMSPREPAEAERSLAAAVLSHVEGRFGPLLYARVDLVPDADGTPVILEVELNEPSLFHAHALGSADRFASAILRRVRSR